MKDNQTLTTDIDTKKDELVSWRQDFHQHPELAFEEKRTSELVAKRLESWGIEVIKPMGKTGVVGKLTAGTGGKTMALRADMDALPIEEATGLSYQSVNHGVMHACGHDGHTTMLLGAARYLAQTKQFDGVVYFVFQPAEETGEGAQAMLQGGLLTQFPIPIIFGLHVAPSLDPGHFSIHDGPVLASSSIFDIRIIGKGTHGAHPHRGIDPIVTASEVVTSLQTIISRRLNPLDPAVLSVTQFHGGTAYNIIPSEVTLNGTVRTQQNSVRDFIKEEMGKMIQGICQSRGCTYQFDFTFGDPAVVNTKIETGIAITAAQKVVGSEKTLTNPRPVMASEDFGFYLEKIPGCYAHLGNGAEKGANHSPQFDFNDEVLTTGVKYWVQLVEDYLHV